MLSKKEILKIIQEQLLFEVRGEILAKNEPQAIEYILRRLTRLFQTFGKRIEKIIDPKSDQNDSAGAENEWFKVIKDLYLKDFNLPEQFSTFIKHNRTQMTHCSPEINAQINLINEYYYSLHKYWNGDGTTVSLKGSISAIKKALRHQQIYNNKLLNKIRSNEFPKFISEMNIEIGKIIKKNFLLSDLEAKQLWKKFVILYEKVFLPENITDDSYIANISLTIKEHYVSYFQEKYKHLFKSEHKLQLTLKTIKNKITSNLNTIILSIQQALAENKDIVDFVLSARGDSSTPDTFAFQVKAIKENLNKISHIVLSFEKYLKQKYDKKSTRIAAENVSHGRIIDICNSYLKDLYSFASTIQDTIFNKIQNDVRYKDKSRYDNWINGSAPLLTTDEKIKFNEQIILFAQNINNKFNNNIFEFRKKMHQSYKETGGVPNFFREKLKMVDDITQKAKDQTCEPILAVVSFVQDSLNKFVDHFDESFIDEVDQKLEKCRKILYYRYNNLIKYYINKYNQQYHPSDFVIDNIENRIPVQPNEFIELKKEIKKYLEDTKNTFFSEMPQDLWQGFYKSFYTPTTPLQQYNNFAKNKFDSESNLASKFNKFKQIARGV